MTSKTEDKQGLYLPKLEESQVNAKLRSKQILRDIYSVNSTMEMWLLLQQVDAFIHSNTAVEEEGTVDFETTKKREVSK